MNELRWNPLIDNWVLIAAHRNRRPETVEHSCPFCPGSNKLNPHYDVTYIDNDFPALNPDPAESGATGEALFKNMSALGKCEVIIYAPGHNTGISQLSLEHIVKLICLWQDRFNILRRDKRIKYVYIFENRGRTVGATIEHPHGQIYAYPFIPKRIQLEIDNGKRYFEENGCCLFCSLLAAELENRERVIIENEDFAVFLPYFTEYPYGVYLFPKKHRAHIGSFNEREREAYAQILRDTIGMYDSLFDGGIPYMMCMHQSPVNCADVGAFFHFHLEFYSPARDAIKFKIDASGEVGAMTHVNPTCPEEKAAELREAYGRYKRNFPHSSIRRYPDAQAVYE